MHSSFKEYLETSCRQCLGRVYTAKCCFIQHDEFDWLELRHGVLQAGRAQTARRGAAAQERPRRRQDDGARARERAHRPAGARRRRRRQPGHAEARPGERRPHAGAHGHEGRQNYREFGSAQRFCQCLRNFEIWITRILMFVRVAVAAVTLVQGSRL